MDKTGVELPESWSLSEQQDIVIGSLVDFAGSFISSQQFCEDIYDEDIKEGPAPAKLRVLMQRCRTIIDDVTDGKVTVEIRRNSGWKMTRKNAKLMKKIIKATN